MTALAAELLEAEVVTMQDRHPGIVTQALSVLRVGALEDSKCHRIQR
jgi:hypothetical protein